MKDKDWEIELWSYLNTGDGINCPVYYTCQNRINGEYCIADQRDLISILYGEHVYQQKSPRNTYTEENYWFSAKQFFSEKWELCPLFKLVERLAEKHLRKNMEVHLPVPNEFFQQLVPGQATEIRYIPMRVYHGAIWQIDGTWIVYLNSRDPPKRQRMTLFHEGFHMLAHNKAHPIFRRRGTHGGDFNEMLADYFAQCILMPKEGVGENWRLMKDIERISDLYQITSVGAWIRLKAIGLE